jgi:hypothetical protein
MAKKWKRPTTAEIDKLRTECNEKKISKERTEMIIANARRSPDESERHAKEQLARFEAECEELPKPNLDELHGRRPPRKLPPESAAYLPNWIHDYMKRKPCAPLPWFWIAAENDYFTVWDGRCFIKGGGWEEVEPHPRRYHDDQELALLYPSAAECLEAAIQISADTGTECEVHAHPSEAYYPPGTGVMYDWLALKRWVRLMVEAANNHFNAGLDPQTPLHEWIRRGYLPTGTVYPVTGLYYWNPDLTRQLWGRLRHEFAPPTYLEILARRGNCSQDG